MFMTVGDSASLLRARNSEGVDLGMNAFALPHLRHHLFPLLLGEFGILRFTAAPAERDR